MPRAFSSQSAELQWAEAVRLFRTRPVLLVWDNFESILPAFDQDSTATLRSGLQPRRSGSAAENRGYMPLPLGNGSGEPEDSPLGFGSAARAELQRLLRELNALIRPQPAGCWLLAAPPSRACPGSRS